MSVNELDIVDAALSLGGELLIFFSNWIAAGISLLCRAARMRL
jgi:hypothetical protein